MLTKILVTDYQTSQYEFGIIASIATAAGKVDYGMYSAFDSALASLFSPR